MIDSKTVKRTIKVLRFVTTLDDLELIRSTVAQVVDDLEAHNGSGLNNRSGK